MLYVLASVAFWLCSLGAHGTEAQGSIVESAGQPGWPKLDEKFNAWPCYEKACKQYVALPPEISRRDLNQYRPQLSESKRAAIQAWLRDNAQAIRHVRQGARKASYWTRLDSEAKDHLRPIGDLACGLLWQAKVTAVEDRDMASAEKDLITGCRVSSHLRQRAYLIEHLVGVSLLVQTSQTASTVLAETGVDPAFVTRLRQSIRCEPPAQFDQELLWVESERLWAWANIQELFVSSADDSVMNWLDALVLVLLCDDKADRMSVFGLRRGRTQTDMLNSYTYAVDYLRKSPWQTDQEGLEFWEDLRVRTHHNPLARWLMFNGPPIARVRVQGQATWDALLCCLAVWQYKQDTGQFPDDLQTLLSKNYLAQLPADPYSDGPLVYRLTADGFTLYSVAANFVDDGGQHEDWRKGHVGGDYVFWPVQSGVAEAD